MHPSWLDWKKSVFSLWSRRHPLVKTSLAGLEPGPVGEIHGRGGLHFAGLQGLPSSLELWVVRGEK